MAKRKKQNEDQPQENIDNTDDTFGLPEIEYEPLKREEEAPEPEPVASEPEPVAEERTEEQVEQPVQENVYQSEEERYIPYDEDEESPSVWPKILGIAALLLIIAAGAWYFAMYRPEQLAKEEKAKQEQAAKDAEAQKKKDAELAEQARLADEQRKADSLANAKPAIGTIETLTERTGRYYVIVASGVDGDLIMDYAKRLSPNGVSSKIIPPNGNVKFYRLAVAEGDTYASTQSTADELKAEYTEGAWVIKF